MRSLDTEKDDHDSWESSGGVRVHDLVSIPNLDLMAGLMYDRAPTPPQTVTLDQPSFSHYGIHGGARYSFGRYRIGVSYTHYWYRVPVVDNSITSPPSNFQGHAGNNIFTLSIEAKL